MLNMPSSNVQMVQARLLINSERRNDPESWVVVDAELLKLRVIHGDLTQEEVVASEYKCFHKECNARVQPYAVGIYSLKTGEKYKAEPKFSLWPGHNHDPDYCDFEKRSGSSSSTQEPVEPSPPLDNYPNNLSLDWSVHVAPLPSGQGGSRGATWFSSNWTAKSIDPIVDVFLRYRHSGLCLDLFIPNVEVQGYKNVFQKILYSEELRLDGWRIYYAEVIYTALPQENEPLTFVLTDGSYDSQSGRPNRRSVVQISPEDWLEGEEKVFREKISEFKRNIIDARRHSSNSLPIIFFLGRSEKDDNSKFSLMIDNWRFVCLRVTDKLDDISVFENQGITSATSPSVEDSSSLETSLVFSNEPFDIKDPHKKRFRPITREDVEQNRIRRLKAMGTIIQLVDKLFGKLRNN